MSFDLYTVDPTKPVGAIRSVVGSRVKLIDSAVETAGEVKSLLEKTNLIRKRASAGRIRFYSSDDPGKFKRLGQRFLGQAINKVEQVQVWSRK